jgi:hypothetical protein
VEAELSYKVLWDTENIMLSLPLRGRLGLEGVLREEGNEGFTVQARKDRLIVVDS